MYANAPKRKTTSNATIFSQENLHISPFQIKDSDDLLNFDITSCIQSNESIPSETSEPQVFPFPTFHANSYRTSSCTCVKENVKEMNICTDTVQHSFPCTGRLFLGELTGGRDLLNKILESDSFRVEDRTKNLEIELLMTREDFVKTPTMPIQRKFSDAQSFHSTSTFQNSISLSEGNPFTIAAKLSSISLLPLSGWGEDAGQSDSTTVLRSGEAPPPAHRTGAVMLEKPWINPSAGDAQESYALKKILCRGAKLTFQDFTNNNLDELMDIIFVESSWATTDILLHTLCLVNRLTERYPQWYQRPPADDAGDREAAARAHAETSRDSPYTLLSHSTRGGGEGPSSHTTPHFSICDHSENGEDPSRGGMERIRWTKSTSLRCFLAALMLSNKFHGDTTYDAVSVCAVVDSVREYQRSGISPFAAAPREGGEEDGLEIPPKAHARPSSSGGVYLRLRPAHLHRCERRVWEALGCSVWVTVEEYDMCGAHVYARGRC
ncbi:unnamed protein product [Phytomonas sp. EM1]|nr:unnamed protein product [Phytomonas sp. EM1]|eukprot:CCW60412.1 unnamed protein product [Phytomonas sp. isolate EM1]